MCLDVASDGKAWKFARNGASPTLRSQTDVRRCAGTACPGLWCQGALSDANVFHYRDNTNLEVDLVLQNRQGSWCALEVKLGAGQVDSAAESLLRLRDRLDLTVVGNPGSLGVIIASGYGYRRPDGIAVVPITALGP